MARFGWPGLFTRFGIYWLLASLIVAAHLSSRPGLMDLSVGQLAGLVVVPSCAIADGSPAWTLPAVLLASGLGLGSVRSTAFSPTGSGSTR